MKKQLKAAIALSIMLASTSAMAQSGIYATATDYNDNKLIYEAQCNKIKLHNFFGYAPTMTIIENGTKHKIRKSDVYGFRNCKNEIYRFYKNKEYKLVETGPIYIYSMQQNIAHSKGFSVVNVYFFSTSPTAPVHPLTYSNLASAYSVNDKFCDLLEQYAGANEASAYDTKHQTFKVNYLYNKSIK